MALNINEADLLKYHTVAVIFPVKDYPDQINELVKVLEKDYNKILYVSLNRLYNPLKRKLTQLGVNTSKFVFVDCVTKTAVPQPEETADCIYTSAPNALTEISIAITKSIQTYYPDIVLFDSLSTLLIYENVMTSSQFVHSLTNKMNAFGVNILFTILDGDKEQPLVKDLNMLLDHVVKIDANGKSP